ncbi:MAG: methyltransferase domain-containing protein [Rhodospirillales bacterium]|nr:methyltransferase domain-containing protein [Rhodospirillales bacterium]
MSPLILSSRRHRMLIGGLDEGTAPLGRSDHFTVYGLAAARADADPEDILVVHDFTPEQIDNNVGAYVADELLPLLGRVRPTSSMPPSGYAYSEQETFERYVGAIVRSMDGNERRAWHRFYDNTLAALRGPAPNPATTLNDPNGNDFVATFRAIYARVAELVSEVAADSILDVATCFGFLPLYLAGGGNGEAGTPRRIAGCDLNPALVALACDYRRQHRVPGVAFVRADILDGRAIRELDPDGAGFDVVTAIHLLEHLTADETVRAMDTLWALTARRLIVAVPFEATPDRRFGHRQVFDRESLLALARCANRPPRYFEHHGGWLVIDRTNQTTGKDQWEEIE